MFLPPPRFLSIHLKGPWYLSHSLSSAASQSLSDVFALPHSVGCSWDGTHYKLAAACVYVCVHECMCEKERDGGNVREHTLHTFTVWSLVMFVLTLSLKFAYFPFALTSVCSGDVWGPSFTTAIRPGVWVLPPLSGWFAGLGFKVLHCS